MRPLNISEEQASSLFILAIQLAGGKKFADCKDFPCDLEGDALQVAMIMFGLKSGKRARVEILYEVARLEQVAAIINSTIKNKDQGFLI